MLNGFNVVLDRFIQPDPPLGEKPPDIAIRELSPDFARALGKEEIDLDNAAEPRDIRIGLAVGFPENLKRRLDEDDGYRVVMPQCEVTSELTHLSDRRFTLFSEVQSEAVKNKEFSGMSGGPIFWSSEDQFGIYGIVYEGGRSAPRGIRAGWLATRPRAQLQRLIHRT